MSDTLRRKDLGQPGNGGRWTGKSESNPEESLPPVFDAEALRRADFQVEARAGEREVENDTAGVIASAVLRDVDTELPELAKVAASPSDFPFGDPVAVDLLHAELTSVYSTLWGRQRDRANALYTWAMYGPPTDVEDTEAA